MKKAYFLTVGLIVFVFAFITCKQDPVDSPTQPPVNHPPVAKAGKDTTLTLASCSATANLILNGGGSSDPDNTSITYFWSVFLSPSFSRFKMPDIRSARPAVSEMTAGKYGFELTVTDPGGLSAKDTIFVDVIGAGPKEYNLDIAITGMFNFLNDNVDCYYCNNPCCYNDVSYVDYATGTFPPIGPMSFYAWENSDTANASNVHDTYFGLYISNNGNGASVYGTSSVNLKRVWLNGGGAFTGTFTPNDGSALGCDPQIFTGLTPLTVTGTLNVTTKVITLNITGKIYF